MKIDIPETTIQIGSSFWYKHGVCSHGPKTFKWWHLFTLNLVRAGYQKDGKTWGRILWFYSRWGTGVIFEISVLYKDNRGHLI